MTNTELLFATVGAITPFLMVAVGMIRAVLRQQAELQQDIHTIREDVAERSARQDTTLGDHDRRITKLEDIVF